MVPSDYTVHWTDPHFVIISSNVLFLILFIFYEQVDWNDILGTYFVLCLFYFIFIIVKILEISSLDDCC